MGITQARKQPFTAYLHCTGSASVLVAGAASSEIGVLQANDQYSNRAWLVQDYSWFNTYALEDQDASLVQVRNWECSVKEQGHVLDPQRRLLTALSLSSDQPHPLIHTFIHSFIKHIHKHTHTGYCHIRGPQPWA